ncbi:hypothetical protein EB001_15730 [bacterium]|nr:hypothetical protein [bacterium]
MKNVQEKNPIYHAILNAYKQEYGVCLASPLTINHLTQWVLNELLTKVLHLDGLSGYDLEEYNPSELTIETDWNFAKSSYIKILGYKKYSILNLEDARKFVEEWNEVMQDYRWERRNNIIIDNVQYMLNQEECDISDEGSLEEFFYYVKNRITREFLND